jgi:glycosyltransferase involved in cell wall biosynthesis
MWIVCQIGAREHYAIPRALHARTELAGLVTDFWVPPGHCFSRLPGARRLRDRFHPELDHAAVHAPNVRMLGFEFEQRLRRRCGWSGILERNVLFQRVALSRLAALIPGSCSLSREISSSQLHLTPLGINGTAQRSVPTLFSYSYAALELFRFAKRRGWRTVLGQIDPGPEEERIVAEEQRRYGHLASNWRPAPASYWESWREEVALADRIIVNSEWSRQCLAKDGVPEEKMEVVPLVFGEKTQDCKTQDAREEGEKIQVSRGPIRGRKGETEGWLRPARERENQEPRTKNQERGTLSVLFLGQINLRKGSGRLLDAMRLLKADDIELTLAGPSEIDPAAWADLPKVRWVGPVPRSEVARYYRTADLFILPTLSDGYALTQLEALAHGLPVLASKSCGAAVTHGENGWLLEDLEPATIAEALRQARLALPLPEVVPPQCTLADLGQALLGHEA